LCRQDGIEAAKGGHGWAETARTAAQAWLDDASRWVTRLERSRDGFATHQDVVLADVPATTPVFQFLPYLGDYNGLLARGDVFLGIFSANNAPDSANFPQGVVYQRRVDFPTHRLLDGSGVAVAVSIDPFFFSVPVLP